MPCSTMPWGFGVNAPVGEFLGCDRFGARGFELAAAVEDGPKRIGRQMAGIERRGIVAF